MKQSTASFEQDLACTSNQVNQLLRKTVKGESDDKRRHFSIRNIPLIPACMNDYDKIGRNCWNFESSEPRCDNSDAAEIFRILQNPKVEYFYKVQEP